MDISLSGHYGYRRLMRTALPSIGMVLVTSVYSIVDGLFVANFVGKVAFAAVNLMYPAMMLLSALGLMVGSGGSALVAKVKGEGYQNKADRIFTMIVRFSALEGLMLGGLFAVATPAIARMLGADAGMMDDCVVYGRVCMLGMPGFVLQMAFQSFYMTAERPALGTSMSVVAGLVNIVLDAVLVAWADMGVTGAALATSASQLVAGIYPLYYFASRRNRGSLHLRRNVRTRWEYIGKACSNGLSEYVSSIAISLVSICYNMQLMRFMGENGVAAYGVVMYISFAFAAVFIGYNIAVTPVIGYNYGANDTTELRSLLRHSVVLVGATGLALTLLAEATSHPCAAIFCNGDAELMQLTVRGIRLYMLCFLVCGWNMFISALFTGLQNGVVSAVAAFARSLVLEMGCVWLLPVFMGPDGIWVAVDVAEGLTLLLCVALLYRYAPQLVRRQ